jgi:hypothetical protein
MNYIKLDKEDLFLTCNETDLFFEYQGKKVAEVLDNGKVKYFEKLPKGYKTEINSFLIDIQTGKRVIV